MTRALYLTHPEVQIDPHRPVPDWRLSEAGIARVRAFAARDVLPKGMTIVSSTEVKALEMATILAGAAGSLLESNEAFGENDRSATGFLVPEEFEVHASRFFAAPHRSIAGWERAVDAQSRIVGAVNAILAGHDPEQPILFAGHGGVGTLLKCHLGGNPIARSQDQGMRANPGGGNLFEFTLAPRLLVCDWTAMEDWMGFGQ